MLGFMMIIKFRILLPCKEQKRENDIISTIYTIDNLKRFNHETKYSVGQRAV